MHRWRACQGNGALSKGGADKYVPSKHHRSDDDDFRRNCSTIFRTLQFYESGASWPVDRLLLTAERLGLLLTQWHTPCVRHDHVGQTRKHEHSKGVAARCCHRLEFQDGSPGIETTGARCVLGSLEQGLPSHGLSASRNGQRFGRKHQSG